MSFGEELHINERPVFQWGNQADTANLEIVRDFARLLIRDHVYVWLVYLFLFIFILHPHRVTGFTFIVCTDVTMHPCLEYKLVLMVCFLLVSHVSYVSLICPST